MTFRTYFPKRGDLVHVNFSPSAGHEMADRHYALVLSNDRYNRRTGMCYVAPITSKTRGWPYEMEAPSGLLPEKRGVGVVKSVLLSDIARHIDFREREIAFISKAPIELVESVLDRLLGVLQDEADDPVGKSG